MRSTFAAAALTAVVAGLMATNASAQPAPDAGGPPSADAGAMHGPMHGGWGHEGHHQGWGHGGMRLTPEERQKLIATRFAAMDTNHDGRVSFEEFKAYRERMKAERQHDWFRRLAGGGDSLTLDRLQTLSSGRGEGGHGWGRGGMAGGSGAR